MKFYASLAITVVIRTSPIKSLEALVNLSPSAMINDRVTIRLSFEHGFRTTILKRVDWFDLPGRAFVFEGHVWYTDGCLEDKLSGSGIFEEPTEEMLSFSLGEYTSIP